MEGSDKMVSSVCSLEFCSVSGSEGCETWAYAVKAASCPGLQPSGSVQAWPVKEEAATGEATPIHS